RFLRIHRSTIVNLDRVRELQPWFHNDYRVILRDGTELMLSRSCRKRLGELLGHALYAAAASFCLNNRSRRQFVPSCDNHCPATVIPPTVVAPCAWIHDSISPCAVSALPDK